MKITITIKEKLYKDLKAYCNLNNIDIEYFCNDAISKELVNQKYGDIPFGVIGNKKKDEELPKIEIDEKEIPPIPTATELMPADRPFDPPDGTGLLVAIDTITSVEKIEEKTKEETNKEKTKNKKRRL